MPVLDPSPIPTYTGSFTVSQATRLLWRAGCGPAPGQATQLASLGLDGAVASLTRPVGAAVLTGASPTNVGGPPLDPLNIFGDASTWWIDRMIRTNQPLIERMTLIWHSWFATSVENSTARMMIDQYWTMRGNALGNFFSLLLLVTEDPAMLMWLNGASNNKYVPNENYGREMMELFTLGFNNGYTQQDVEEQARALTGWDHSYGPQGPYNIHYDPTLHDAGLKTIFGQTGPFMWRDSCRLVMAHPAHPAFMVTKLWNYFVGAPPAAADLATLCTTYVQSGFQVQPLVEAILRHPLFYQGPLMVIPPAVYVAGLHRAAGLTITTSAWSWICNDMGQLLFFPPDVGGWDYTRWLDTARWQGRLTAVNHLLLNYSLDPHGTYATAETSQQALTSALNFWAQPVLTAATTANLIAFGNQVQQTITANWEQSIYWIERQNALRTLIPTSPDWQTC
jgi:uncharacterized protein (DUF1800 family)